MAPNPTPTRVAQKLKLLASRLRNSHVPLVASLAELENNLDGALDSSSDLIMMPVRMKISPNIKAATETRAVMMPPKKTRAKRVGDPAYGGGTQSGRKAKKARIAMRATALIEHLSLILAWGWQRVG